MVYIWICSPCVINYSFWLAFGWACSVECINTQATNTMYVLMYIYNVTMLQLLLNSLLLISNSLLTHQLLLHLLNQ